MSSTGLSKLKNKITNIKFLLHYLGEPGTGLSLSGDNLTSSDHFCSLELWCQSKWPRVNNY